MSNATVIKFLFNAEWRVLNDAIKIDSTLESEDFSAAADLCSFLNCVPSALIITSLRDKNDLIQIATLLKMIKSSAPVASFKVMIVNFSGNKQFEQAASKLGILDIIDDKINTKALKFKIDFMLKSINAQAKKNSDIKVKQVKSSEQEKQVNTNLPSWMPPLDCKDDIWLLKNESDCKKVLTRWLIKLMGPGPTVAQWQECEGGWRLEFKNSTEDFIKEQGAWFYRGDQKPEFIWSENLWLFTGSSCDLFYKVGTTTVSKVKLLDKVLQITRNSDHAKAKEKKIIESYDKEYSFKKENVVLEDNVDKFDKEQERYKNLDGKGKTENLKHKPLSGKGNTSDLSSDPLSLELDPEAAIKSDNLIQKKSTEREKTYWNSKNTYEKNSKKAELSSPAQNKVNSGAELSLATDNKLEKYYKSDSQGMTEREENESNLKLLNQISSKAHDLPLEAESEDEEYNISESTSEVVFPFNASVSKELTEVLETPKVSCSIFQGSLEVQCHLDDFFDQTIILKAKDDRLKADQPVYLFLNFHYQGKNTNIMMNGTLSEIEKTGEGLNYFNVQISKEDELNFDNFMKLFSTRQKNIEIFMKAAKGF